MENENSVSVTPEFAEQEFGRILSAADVEWEDVELSMGKQAANEKRKVIRAIVDGKITVDDDGFPTIQTKSDVDKLKKIKVFREAMRSDILAIDRVKTNQGYDNSNLKEDAALGNFVNIDKRLIGTLRQKDYKLLYAVWTIFLGD